MVRQVRQAFPNILLMGDANSAYTLHDVDLFKQMDKYDLMMLEQPLNYEDMIDHAELQRQIRTPVCLDESIHSSEDARKAIKIGACKIINIKLGRVGGHKEARAVHDVCRDHGIPVWCGGMLESGIGRAHNVALSSLENFSLPGDVSASKRYWAEDIIDPRVEVSSDGQIAEPTGPGIGYASERRFRPESHRAFQGFHGMTIYEADWVCPVSSAPVRHGRLGVDNGAISMPRQMQTSFAFPDAPLFPASSTLTRTSNSPCFAAFLTISPSSTGSRGSRTRSIECSLAMMSRISAQLGAVEMLRAGVTCLGEVMDLGVAWDAMQEFGLRGVAYQEVFGPSPQQASDALRGLQEKIDDYHRNETSTLRAGVSPHAPYTVSAKLYEEVNRFAERERLRMTTHIAESADEGMFVRRGAGIFAERLRARGIQVEPADCSPLEYIDRLGLLRPEMLLVHGIDLDASDFERFKEKRPALVHCPKSNAKLAQGVAPITTYTRPAFRWP